MENKLLMLISKNCVHVIYMFYFVSLLKYIISDISKLYSTTHQKFRANPYLWYPSLHFVALPQLSVTKLTLSHLWSKWLPLKCDKVSAKLWKVVNWKVEVKASSWSCQHLENFMGCTVSDNLYRFLA